MDHNVLIVGGGIHGVGLAHDLATRRIPGVHLAESSVLASGTSSRSTKLVHGGLRYLEHVGQWSLVHEALRERGILLRILRGLVQPLPFVLPAFKGDRPAWMIRAGLFLYDLLAGDGGLPRARKLGRDEVFQVAPYLRRDRVEQQMNDAFLYYDAQMLDDVIVRIAAFAAVKLGATFDLGTRVTSVRAIEVNGERGFRCMLEGPEGRRELTTRTVVNAAGAWCNSNLLSWGIAPQVSCLLNVGTHLVYKPEAVNKPVRECAATLLQNSDGRVVFFVPWNGRWLFGTTESVLREGDPRGLRPPEEDVRYLAEAATHSLDLIDPEANLEESFCGVRTMPLRGNAASLAAARGTGAEREAWERDPFSSPFYVREGTTANISALSRETVVDETVPGLLSIYGGKYTTYRAQCENIGARLSRLLKLGGTTGTQVEENWFLAEVLAERPELLKSSPDVRRL